MPALSERMEEFGTDMAVVSSLNGIFYKNTQFANEELFEDIRSKKAYQNRFIPFAVINPIYNGWRDDFETSVTKLGMKGIRLHPIYHGYELDHPACIELVKMARDRGIPIAFSLRMVDSRPSSWLDVEKEWTLASVMPIIRAVPDAKYMILNLANSVVLDEKDAALLKKSTIIMDTSGRNVLDLGGLLKTYGSDKFCFGTHSPVLDYCTGLLRIESLRPDEADEKTKEMLRSENLRKFLNI
ncbi:amidohydrolase [Daejeonella sp.]|uniref:amidohydrolase family protein n=1 Tax=Daejeonella sp. TaxID=2805397 RepID=UPI0030C2375F